MTNQIQPATDEQRTAIERALTDLRRARDLLAFAKAGRAADKVRRAIKSADGARRHVSHRLARSTKEPDPHAPRCPSCNEPKTMEAETWQQWQCACCGSWNDKPVESPNA